jgi:hypothetical protein
MPAPGVGPSRLKEEATQKVLNWLPEKEERIARAFGRVPSGMGPPHWAPLRDEPPGQDEIAMGLVVILVFSVGWSLLCFAAGYFLGAG